MTYFLDANLGSCSCSTAVLNVANIELFYFAFYASTVKCLTIWIIYTYIIIEVLGNFIKIHYKMKTVIS